MAIVLETLRLLSRLKGTERVGYAGMLFG